MHVALEKIIFSTIFLMNWPYFERRIDKFFSRLKVLDPKPTIKKGWNQWVLDFWIFLDPEMDMSSIL